MLLHVISEEILRGAMPDPVDPSCRVSSTRRTWFGRASDPRGSEIDAPNIPRQRSPHGRTAARAVPDRRARQLSLQYWRRPACGRCIRVCATRCISSAMALSFGLVSPGLKIAARGLNRRRFGHPFPAVHASDSAETRGSELRRPAFIRTCNLAYAKSRSTRPWTLTDARPLRGFSIAVPRPFDSGKRSCRERRNDSASSYIASLSTSSRLRCFAIPQAVSARTRKDRRRAHSAAN